MIQVGGSILNSVINVFKKIEYLMNIPLTLSLSPEGRGEGEGTVSWLSRE